MKIKHFKCVDASGKSLRADIFAKNAAITCPTCRFPILFVEINTNNDASDLTAAQCNKCKKTFQVESDEEKELLIVTEKK